MSRADRPRDPLPPGELHLWEATLGEPPPDAGAVLAPEERERAARFRAAADAARWTAARCTLRGILSGYLGTEPSSVRLRYAPHGKPELDAPWDGSGIQFNVSHTADLLMVAVARGARVGVDLETVRPVSHAERVASRIFGGAAAEAWRQFPEEERTVEFFRLWSRLEAAAKLHGEGVWRTVRLGIDPPGVTVRSLRAPEGCVAAVAAEGEPRIVFRRIDGTDGSVEVEGRG